jgi:hypothetical protein
MRRPVLHAIGLIVLCLCSVGCGSDVTPSPEIKVSILAANDRTQMIKDEETAFLIEIEPPNLKPQVHGIRVQGDKGIQCEQSKLDMWTWYCTGTQEAKAAIVFAEITGTFPAQTARHAVEVVAPTPTPTNTPTSTPTCTPTPTDTPTSTPTYTPTPTDTPTPTPTYTPTPAYAPTPTEIGPHAIYVGRALGSGYDMGVNTSGGRTDWVTDRNGYMRMAYPGDQDWGAVSITVGEPTDPPRPGQDLSHYQTLSLELRGRVGGEQVWIGLKDSIDPDDGSETKIWVHGLSKEWQTYQFLLSDFDTADVERLYVVIEFVFEPGTPAETVDFRNVQYLPTPAPEPTATVAPILTFTPTPTEISSHVVYVGTGLTSGYDMGVDTSGGRTDWVTDRNGYIRMAYPGDQDWGAVFITVGEPTDPPRRGQDLSHYQTLSLELRGEVGGEQVWIGLKDNMDPDDGSETKIWVHGLSKEWQTYQFPLSAFRTADLQRLYVVIEFVFEPGTPAETVNFRNVHYLPTPTPTYTPTPTSTLRPQPAKRFSFEPGTMGWLPQGGVEDTQAVTDVAQSTIRAWSGWASLVLEVNLIGGDHPTNSKGEAFVDMRYNLPTGTTTPAPYDLTGTTITCWVYAPPGSAGDANSPNGFQVFVKDKSFKSEYGTWENIAPEREGTWFQISLTSGTQVPPGGYMDPEFDPTRIVLLGVKIGAGGKSTDQMRYTGPVYIDACDW